jgi:hypothetical protein
MITHRHCPTCKTRGVIPMHDPRSIDRKTNELTISITSQSSGEEGGPLEQLFPLPGSKDDGREIRVTHDWDPEKPGQVHLKFTREPRADRTQRQTNNEAVTREDLLTKAALLNIQVNEKWNKAQLAKAVADAEEAAASK